MASTFFGLNIGTTGMQAYQASLNTTAHNISNIGSDGYTRQNVNLSANPAISVSGGYGMVGAGVQIDDITQERDLYYDDKYRFNNSILGNYSTKEHYLSSIQSYLYTSDGKTGGITTGFDDLYNSLTNLTSDPSDMTMRTDTAILSESFAEYVSSFADSLQVLQDEANVQIETVVSQINALGSEVASLTKRINTYEINGERANDLRDERNALLDELSEYVDITVKEMPSKTHDSNPVFMVYVDGAILVDCTESYSLRCEATEGSVNQNDIQGLYTIKWTNGQDFNQRSKTLGGSLQALLEVRDGNNEDNFKAVASAVNEVDGKTVISVTDASCNDLSLLNIPATNGRITIGNITYTYESFEVEVGSDGMYNYEFTLKGNHTESQIESLQYACDNQKPVNIGESIEYKGIPYYMAQLNEFVRTFSRAFNEIHNAGYDLKSEQGIDWLNAKDDLTGDNYEFDENPTSFSSVVSADEDGVYRTSYYSMTGLNFSVNREILEDPGKIACMKMPNIGVGNNENLKKLVDLKEDNSVFIEGTPDAYLHTLISAVGIDCKQAESLSKSQDNILIAIDTRRESVSGVDKDEEAANLVKFQNLLFSQYKVLSVMNNVLDKLINGTAL
ncbi:MAG: flagellar hook-associated protein FlgK [Lachnospiraceae bacterium]|nr:flagellar hook-associated protein FlgK [Lachnospiraceae bacterium]